MYISQSKRARNCVMRTLCLTAVAAMALPGSAWADQIFNNLDTSIDSERETLSLTVPNSGRATIYVKPTDDADGQPSCNLQGNSESVTFSVVSSDTSKATVSPASITFDNCGDLKPVIVTAVAQGAANITFTRTHSTGAVGTFDAAPANFAVNVAAVPPPVVNVAPTVGAIAGPASVDEGDSGSYGVTATDQDGDTLTYLWTITGGNATITSSNSGSSVDVDFSDGPSTVGLRVEVRDGNGHVVTRTLSITENNVAPSVALNGAAVADEGDTKTYSYSVSDPGADTLTVTESCGSNGTRIDTAAANSFQCTFPDGPANSMVSVSADDGDTSNNIGADQINVAVANVAPTVVLNGAVSALEGETKSYSYSVSDPGDDIVVATPSCGAASFSNATATGFDCTFPDNGSYTVSVSANDGDNTGSASETVAVANVAPSFINWSLTGANGTACIGGNTVSLSFSVLDPADDANDPISGAAFQAFSGRTVSQSKVIGPGSWTQVVTADDGDGGTATRTAGGAFLYDTTGGFPLAPINTDGTSNFKLGSTIPVKLRVLDCNKQPVSGLAPQVNLVRTTTSVDGTVNEEVITTSVPDDGRTMRYDGAGLQYIYNLSTKRSVFAVDGGALTVGRYKLSISGTGLAPLSVGFDILK